MGFLLSLLVLLATFLARGSFAMIYDERCIGCIDVDVYFHVVSYDNGTIYFNNHTETIESIIPMIHENMRIANYELNETPFVFNWKNSDNIPVLSNTNWTLTLCERRSELNSWSFLGDSKSINVYLGHNMHFNSSSVGCASYPAYDHNGVWMEFGILPPGGNGLTLAHEFGHWLGLLHTFTSFANAVNDKCHPSNAGDLVHDTPIQLAFDLDTYTNQTSWDSCPDQPGEDAFWNLMNKVCRRRVCFGDRAYLTEGQIQRMYIVWLFYRQHNETCDDDQFLFSAEFPTQRLYDQVVIFDEFEKEVYNLRTSYVIFRGWEKSVSMNMCLHRNTSYFVASYYGSFGNVPDTVYYIDGQVVKTTEKDPTRLARLFPVLTLERNSSSQGNALLTYETPSSGCNSTTEAMLEFDGLDGINDVSIHDMTGQRRALRRDFSVFEGRIESQCVPRNGHYALLVCLRYSESSNYTVLVDGFPQATVDGPFHNPVGFVPRCLLNCLLRKCSLSQQTFHPYYHLMYRVKLPQDRWAHQDLKLHLLDHL